MEGQELISRHGIIYRLLTVFLFAGYVTYVLPAFIKYNVQIGFFGNSVMFGSLMLVAYGISKALAHSEDRKYLLVAALGIIIPLVYFATLGLSLP